MRRDLVVHWSLGRTIRTDFASEAQLGLDERPFHVVFDVSDVINYFRSARLPTGIQRVQIEVVGFAIRDASFPFSIACFTKEANYWIDISREQFEFWSSLSTSDLEEGAWTDHVAKLEAAILKGKPFQFPPGSILLNLGSSWWLQNYFLGVRHAKTEFDILYVPFIHDLIPMAMPELCVAELRSNFDEWIDSVFDHADFFMVNSRNTLSDLRAAARDAGVEPEAAVIALDADFRNAWNTTREQSRRDPAGLLNELGLKRGGFVLFVSTIEPRKNHAMVFNAWLKLLRRHGVRNCPVLVCVGQPGWLNSEAHARLAASTELQRHVVILSDVSDAALAVLYQSCLCTLYPSLYEGWGLPVTESLCYGKVPIVSRVASLPEAGGDFAEYFDVNAERTFIAAVERIVFDRENRQQREEAIRAGFRPRSWGDIGAAIVAALKALCARTPLRRRKGNSAGRVYPIRAQTGAFYSLAGETMNARGHKALRGEIFRNGPGWWWPEPWGCWIRERGPATLAFVVPDAAHARLIVHLGVRGVQRRNGVGIVRVSGRQRLEIALQGDEEACVSIWLEPEPEQERQIVIDFLSREVADFRPVTAGVDFRVCGIGVKWFFVCREDDIASRINLADTLLLEQNTWIGFGSAS